MSAEGEKAAEEPKPVEAPAAPVFGSAATFTGTGFGGFTLNAGVAGKGGESPSDAPANGGGEEASSSGNADADPEAECQAEFKPLVTLEEVHAPGTWTVERVFTPHCGIRGGITRIHVNRRLLVVSVLFG